MAYILRSHKIRSTFYTENSFHKLLCKPKDRVTTQGKNNIVYRIDWSNCEAVYFGESKRTLKSRSDEHKRSIRNCNWDKNETAKHYWGADHNFSWDQKKVVDRESRLISRKIVLVHDVLNLLYYEQTNKNILRKENIWYCLVFRIYCLIW